MRDNAIGKIFGKVLTTLSYWAFYLFADLLVILSRDRRNRRKEK